LGPLRKKVTDALGIMVAPGVDVRGLFFADDIAFMARSRKSHQQQIQLLTLYEEGAAAKVNKRKSALFSFRGLPPNSLSDFSPGKNDGERYLSILFGLQGIIPQLPTLVESIVQSMDHFFFLLRFVYLIANGPLEILPPLRTRPCGCF
jgi:hypothetical protein